MLTETERSIRGKIGAFTLHSRYDSRELTAPARAKFLDKFLDQVDPDRMLPEKERLRRAEAAKRAHFQKLALKSAQTRRRKASAS